MQRKFEPYSNLPSSSVGDEDIGLGRVGGCGDNILGFVFCVMCCSGVCFSYLFTLIFMCNVKCVCSHYYALKLGLFYSITFSRAFYIHIPPFRYVH